MRIAVIDSGCEGLDSRCFVIAGNDCIDRIGHGTTVARIIHSEAPTAELIPVKIFDRTLTCRIEYLVKALEWCAENSIDIANLSVGTANPSHARALNEAVVKARAAGVTIVAAHGWLPGSLEGVIGVDEDRTCPPGSLRERVVNGRRVVACAGEGRGVSFAVAHGTGLLAALFSAEGGPTRPDLS